MKTADIEKALCANWLPYVSQLAGAEIMLLFFSNPNLLNGCFVISRCELASKKPFKLMLFTSNTTVPQLTIDAGNAWLLDVPHCRFNGKTTHPQAAKKG